MATLPKLIGCPTCSVTIDEVGAVHHEETCVTVGLAKHKSALQKIGHILKEIGITTGEVVVEIAAHQVGISLPLVK
jgi:GTP-sensing pleiotropic transcriptional regulator CodY